MLDNLKSTDSHLADYLDCTAVVDQCTSMRSVAFNSMPPGHREAPVAAPPRPGAFVLERMVSLPAGAPLVGACLAPNGATVLVTTVTGALLLLDLAAGGAVLARKHAPAATLDPPAEGPGGAAPWVRDQAGMSAQALSQDSAQAEEPGLTAIDTVAGLRAGEPDHDRVGQWSLSRAAPAAFGEGPEGPGQRAGSHREDDAMGLGHGDAPGSGSGFEGQGYTEDEAGQWDLSDQLWAVMGGVEPDPGAKLGSDPARGFQPLCSAFHVGGAVMVDAVEHQPLLATLGRDNVLRWGNAGLHPALSLPCLCKQSHPTLLYDVILPTQLQAFVVVFMRIAQNLQNPHRTSKIHIESMLTFG